MFAKYLNTTPLYLGVGRFFRGRAIHCRPLLDFCDNIHTQMKLDEFAGFNSHNSLRRCKTQTQTTHKTRMH